MNILSKILIGTNIILLIMFFFAAEGYHTSGNNYENTKEQRDLCIDSSLTIIDQWDECKSDLRSSKYYYKECRAELKELEESG